MFNVMVVIYKALVPTGHFCLSCILTRKSFLLVPDTQLIHIHMLSVSYFVSLHKLFDIINPTNYTLRLRVFAVKKRKLHSSHIMCLVLKKVYT